MLAIPILPITMENEFNSIQYYALDVLKYIFEYAVNGVSPAECFKIATSLSHVCRQWRMAALDTPRLWAYIHCDMGKEDNAIKDFWARTPSRVRGLPTTVRVLNVGMYQNLSLLGSLEIGVSRWYLQQYYQHVTLICEITELIERVLILRLSWR